MAARHLKSSYANKKTDKFTFEQLCIRKEIGFSIDINTLFIPSNPHNFDEVVFKIISKIDTSLLLLSTHGDDVLSYTVIAIPLSSHGNIEENVRGQGRGRTPIQPSKSSLLDYTNVYNAWEYLNTEGWHCLQSISLLQLDSLPNNGSRVYSLYQYTTCIMDVIRANYMFQKHTDNFHHETLEMFNEDDIKGSKHAVFGLIWKRSTLPLNPKCANVLSQKRKSSIPVPVNSPQKRRKDSMLSSFHNSMVEDVMESSQSSDATDSEEEMEVEEEITFKDTNAISQHEKDEQMFGEESSVTSSKGRRRMPKKEVSPLSLSLHKVVRPPPVRDPSPPKKEASPVAPPVAPKELRRKKKKKKEEEDTTPPPPPPSPPPTPLEDVVLGFETNVNTSTKASRKSMARKSMSSADWPEDERKEILQIFDDFNPNVSEQKRIALTCKYVALQLDKDLPSKLLYQWVQKKGREVNRTITSFNVPAAEQQKEVALAFFRQLNDSSSESARIAFSLKYLDAQYGLSVTSKQLYTWLTEKPAKKGQKKR